MIVFATDLGPRSVMHHLITATLHTAPSRKVDVVVGLDARGFLLGPLVALRLGAAFVPVRKKGKLPGECVSVEYQKEYGSDFFEADFNIIDVRRQPQLIVLFIRRYKRTQSNLVRSV